MTEEAHPEAAMILQSAGWTAHPEWGVYTRGTLIMGGFAGSFHVKDFARIPPDHPLYSDDTPDTAEEAAAWLVQRFGGVHDQVAVLDAEIERDLAQDDEASETPQHESDGETGESNEASPSEPVEGSASGGDEDATEKPDAVPLSDTIDAEFTVEDLGSEDQLDEPDFETLAIEGADLEPETPAQDGPIAYGASTIDGLIREKLGRVSQIARELKAVQQEGWTVEEYAYLQNLIVRMDRGEAPDDQASRTRFIEIAGKSQAMSRIDAVRDRKEGELEEIGQRRDFDAAVYYEPGEGWP